MQALGVSRMLCSAVIVNVLQQLNRKYGLHGLLDNIGSLLGVPQLARAVTKFSKSGTIKHIFEYHGMHAEGIVEACGQILSETALEQVSLHPEAMAALRQQEMNSGTDWRELWPQPE